MKRLCLSALPLVLLAVPFVPAPSLVELTTVTAIQEELNSTATGTGLHALNRVEVQSTMTDLQTLRNAVEQYRADNGAFPVPIRMSSPVGPAPGNESLQHVFTFVRPVLGGPATITHPRPYVSTVPNDRYSQAAAGQPLPYAYFVDRASGHYIIWSPGPDNDYDLDPVRDFWTGGQTRPSPQQLRARLMDPNNPNDNDGDLAVTNRPI